MSTRCSLVLVTCLLPGPRDLVATISFHCLLHAGYPTILESMACAQQPFGLPLVFVLGADDALSVVLAADGTATMLTNIPSDAAMGAATSSLVHLDDTTAMTVFALALNPVE